MKPKVIGIMGGMGPEATRDLFAKIIANTPAKSDQEHLPVIAFNFPRVPDRTANIIGNGPDPVPAMLEMARGLERAGADFIIIPCISAHYFLDRLRAQSPLPILSAFEATAEAIMLCPGVTTVGLLATTGTVKGGRFAGVLAQSGLVAAMPDDGHQAMVMEAVYGGIKSDPTGEHRGEHKELLLRAADHLTRRGAQGIIAGCTEIPLALKQEDLAVPYFDTLELLAHAAIKHAAGKR